MFYFIHIIGAESKRAVDELGHEFPDFTRTSIQPTCIACERTNQMPTWRFEIQRSFQNNTNVINNGGRANCDEITDLARSVRALSNSYHPLVFSTEPSDCSQVNGTYTLERVKDLLFLYR